MSGENNDIANNPIIWAGFRNGGTGMIRLSRKEPEPTTAPSRMFVYPSPVRSGIAVLRMENPSGQVDIRMYDITGKLLKTISESLEPTAIKDFQFDVSGYASGVYLISVKQNGKIMKTKFAIEK
jgi:hypothetical protein